jgi:hypothetical protein
MERTRCATDGPPPPAGEYFVGGSVVALVSTAVSKAMLLLWTF